MNKILIVDASESDRRLIAGLDKQARHEPTVRFGGIYN